MRRITHVSGVGSRVRSSFSVLKRNKRCDTKIVRQMMQNKPIWMRNRKIEAMLKILTNETEGGRMWYQLICHIKVSLRHESSIKRLAAS
jgi:hypothetical protein